MFAGRGGQSALRFARLRLEKRHNYVRKVAETAVQMFIANDKVNVSGLVLAGSADFKNELSQSDMFDPVSRLCCAICVATPYQFHSVCKLKSSRLSTYHMVARTASIKRSS